MFLINSRATIINVNGGVGGGLSASTAYSDPIDCSKATAIKVRLAYTKATQDLTVGLVDASDSANATIAGTYDPIVSTRQSTGSSATTFSLTATGRAVLVSNLGALCGKVRLAYSLGGAGAAGDILIAEVTTIEEG